MNRMRAFAGWRIGEYRLDVNGVKPIRSMAELAGDGDGPVLSEYVLHLIRPKRPQEIGHPSLVAPALELNRSAAKQPQIVSRESAIEQLLDRALEQLVLAETLNPPLSVLPDLLHVRLIDLPAAGQLLNQDAGAAFGVRSQNHARG